MQDALLWVDDEPETIAAACQYLKTSANLKVDVAATVEAAIHKVRLSFYKFVVIDIGVPITNGEEYPKEFEDLIQDPSYAGAALLDFLHLNPSAGRRSHLFVCSGHSQEFVERLVQETTPVDFISKSVIFFDPEALKDYLGQATAPSVGESRGQEPKLNGSIREHSYQELHDLKNRLLHISRTLSIVLLSSNLEPSKVEPASGLKSKGNAKKRIVEQVELIENLLDAIDVSKGQEYVRLVDQIQNFLDGVQPALRASAKPNYSMLSEASRKALKWIDREAREAGLAISVGIERIGHLCNYATLEDTILDVRSCVELLGEPVVRAENQVQYRKIIEVEANALQRIAFSRNLDIRLQLKSMKTINHANVPNFRSAFHNILGNAIKYNGDTGPKRTWVDVKLREEGDQMIVEVESWGVPIPTVEKEKLTLSGFRGSNASTTGYGLGLSIAQDKVRQLGGEMLVETRPTTNNKEITTFKVVLPLDLG